MKLVWEARDSMAKARATRETVWRWIGDREGIHWPDLGEDISVENFPLGQPSGESQDSFRRWLEGRVERQMS